MQHIVYVCGYDDDSEKEMKIIKNITLFPFRVIIFLLQCNKMESLSDVTMIVGLSVLQNRNQIDSCLHHKWLQTHRTIKKKILLIGVFRRSIDRLFLFRFKIKIRKGERLIGDGYHQRN